MIIIEALMPKTESNVGNDDCAKWTTEASTDKAQVSVESPACVESPAYADFAASTIIAEPPASVERSVAVGRSAAAVERSVHPVAVAVAAMVAPASLPRPHQMLLGLRDGYPTLDIAHCG